MLKLTLTKIENAVEVQFIISSCCM